MILGKKKYDPKHGPEFINHKNKLKQETLGDPNQLNKYPEHIRGWLKNEKRQRGNNPAKWRNPPGYDAGHPINGTKKDLRWEEISPNRRRGGKYKK